MFWSLSILKKILFASFTKVLGIYQSSVLDFKTWNNRNTYIYQVFIMGLFISRLYEAYQEFMSGGTPSRILMLGLDAAGKSISCIFICLSTYYLFVYFVMCNMFYPSSNKVLNHYMIQFFIYIFKFCCLKKSNWHKFDWRGGVCGGGWGCVCV